MSIRTTVFIAAAAAILQPLALVAATTSGPACAADARHQAVEAYGRLPLAFEANAGQYDPSARFLARGSGYALWLTPREAVLALATSHESASRFDDEPAAQLRLQLVGARNDVTAEAEDRLPGVVNHYNGSDPAQWRTNVPTFARVRYASVYPGIDLVYYGNQRQLEYDFVVAPGADPSAVALRFSGADAVRLDEDGSLRVSLAGRELRWNAPVLYQAAGDARVPVAGGYRLLADATVGFSVPSWDRSAPLVIDPVLVYSSYLGGALDDHAFSVAVDETGRAYVTGFTYSIDFPTVNPAQAANAGAQDVFVTKLDKTGTSLVYSTYLGGSAYDVGRGITLDVNLNAYLTGSTSSTNFPFTAGVYDMTHNGNQDVFVAKLDQTGALVWATYVGSPGNEQGEDIAVDNGRAYVTGYTEDSTFPTTGGAWDTSYNGGAWDAFVFRLSPAGTNLVNSTFLGGSGYDYAYGIALDGGEPFVTGYTTSTNFPFTAGAWRTTYSGSGDAFVTHLNANLSGPLQASTYFGGTGGDWAEDIALGDAGNVFIAGGTSSANLATTGAYDTTQNGSVDAFVAKLDGGLTAPVYATYIGGDGYDSAHGIAVNTFGGALVTGFTGSANFPTVNPTQAAFAGGTYDAFVLKVAPSGDALNFSTYLGGPGYDLGYEIALDGCGNPYAVGKAGDGFPTTVGAFDTSWNGAGDGFVTKYQ